MLPSTADELLEKLRTAVAQNKPNEQWTLLLALLADLQRRLQTAEADAFEAQQSVQELELKVESKDP